VAERVKTRYTPILSFVLDQGVKKSIEASRLIREALGDRQDKDSDVGEDETLG
jgi:ribosome-binding factor A